MKVFRLSANKERRDLPSILNNRYVPFPKKKKVRKENLISSKIICKFLDTRHPQMREIPHDDVWSHDQLNLRNVKIE
jgi:hypothetical protein